ncbi:AfsR/SARP family transcriptional regulator [Streptomyces collinus]|uniref:AfsR/SARP family transcriptional regulator n=1 Tax=Streptomyces collinus TaxID=42684 RepID=UPI0033E559F6
MTKAASQDPCPVPGPRLDLTVLGEVRCLRDGVELPLGGPRPRSLLAMLVLRAGTPVGRDELHQAVWSGDGAASGGNLVQVYVSKLRRLLEPQRAPRAAGGVVERVGSSYRLAVTAEEHDLGRFQTARDEARALRAAGEPVAAERALARALAEWQGPPLTGVGGPLLEIERARLTELRLAAVEEHAELALLAGTHAEAVPSLVALTAEHPYRERLWALLMHALYRAGRQADALAAYQRASRLLGDHLGLTPGPELRATQQAVLAGTPAPLPGATPPTPRLTLLRTPQGPAA